MPSTLLAFARDHVDADVHCRHVVGGPPIAGERRIEHLAQPVDDHGLAHLAEDAIVDRGVVVGRARAGGERPARHQDDPPAQRLDRLDLLLVGGDHIADAKPWRRRQMIGARPARDQRSLAALGCREALADQLERARPVQAHAALGGVHRLGDAQPQVPKMLAKRDGARPVDRRLEPGVDIRERVGDHVGRCERHPVERAGRGDPGPRRAHPIGGLMADRGR